MRLDAYERFCKERTHGSWRPMTDGAHPVESKDEVESLAKAAFERWNTLFPKSVHGGYSVLSVPGSKGYTIVWHDGTLSRKDEEEYVRLYLRHSGRAA